MEPVVKYHCPVCDKEHGTPEEAEKCFVPLGERFKQGDVIVMGYINSPKRVMYPIKPGEMGITAELIAEHSIATCQPVKKGIDARGYYVGSGMSLCGAKKYPLEDAKKLVSDLRRRLKNAEKFLEMVKKMYEEENNA